MAKKAPTEQPTAKTTTQKGSSNGAVAKNPKQKGSRPPVKHVAAAVEKARDFAAMLERGSQAKLEKQAASLKKRTEVAADAAVGSGGGGGGSGGGGGGGVAGNIDIALTAPVAVEAYDIADA